MLCRDNYLVHRLNTSTTLLVVLGLKGTVHPKMKNLSFFFFFHVIPNQIFVLQQDTKEEICCS